MPKPFEIRIFAGHIWWIGDDNVEQLTGPRFEPVTRQEFDIGQTVLPGVFFRYRKRRGTDISRDDFA